MYTEPKITLTKDLRARGYISFYLNGQRVRIFNGRTLNLSIYPNRSKSYKERLRLFNDLLFDLNKALKNNGYPINVKKAPVQIKVNTTKDCLFNALKRKLDSDLSRSYKTDLKAVYNKFIEFLTEEEKMGEIISLKVNRIEEFLALFGSSGTYYMNKRRALGVILNSASKNIGLNRSIIKETESRRTKATLHQVYSNEQLKNVLAYLKSHHKNLHLCCLISYGCLLRPHQEIRNLRGYHFKNDHTEIHLSGSENKGKKVRVVYVPDYVRHELQDLITSINPLDNIFTRDASAFNEAYFNTAWSRLWKKMNKEGLIREKQTIYSFRHTAAVEVYQRTKDVNLLKSLLGHSSILVTLKYLRGLGEYNEEILKDAAPRLEF
jgi:integrase